MKKYLSVISISTKKEFMYRFNFLMWRVRNIISILLILFLWDSLYSGQSNRLLFGYTKEQMFTWVFALLIVKAFVFSVKSNEVGGEIASGDLSKYLLMPVSYKKYWFGRDISVKIINIVFSLVETLVLVSIFKPTFYLQTNVVNLIFFAITLLIAPVIYFFILLIFESLVFWYSEQAWGFVFLLGILTDFLSGGLFPLDILPHWLQAILYLTPFPYMLYVPVRIYLGGIDQMSMLILSLLSVGWVSVLYVFSNKVWKLGLKNYGAYGI